MNAIPYRLVACLTKVVLVLSYESFPVLCGILCRACPSLQELAVEPKYGGLSGIQEVNYLPVGIKRLFLGRVNDVHIHLGEFDKFQQLVLLHLEMYTGDRDFTWQRDEEMSYIHGDLKLPELQSLVIAAAMPDVDGTGVDFIQAEELTLRTVPVTCESCLCCKLSPSLLHPGVHRDLRFNMMNLDKF